jgi:hypothetical protein
MEDLLNNDSTFELFTNSSDSEILNKTLMSYPSEKSSFDVFLGADGDDMLDYSYFETTTPTTPTETERKFDAEKIAEGVVATGTAVTSVASTIQAFKGDGTKTKSRKQQLKDVCGRKPLLKKNRVEYDKCVSDYNAGRIGGMVDTNQRGGGTEYRDDTKQSDDAKAKSDNTKKIIIGLVVVAVVVTAFVGYKKGWFAKKP